MSAPTLGKVVLVGAGPGDPELITVAGLRWLGACDALVYDHLLTESFVARSTAKEKHFVGKAAGQHSLPQAEINRLLVRLAQEGKVVVRLKGGDPFLFGRGAEECEALRQAGIPFEIVPGVSSGPAAAAYAGLPLTQRGFSDGVTFVTAHLTGGAELPWRELAGLGHTLVFYMALAFLENVAARLIAAGLAPDTPALAVERATTLAAREIEAPLWRIATDVRAARLQAPTLLFVGACAAEKRRLLWRELRPLAGKGVLLLRGHSAQEEQDAVARLRELGVEVLDVPPAPVATEDWLKVKLANWQPDLVLCFSEEGAQAVLRAVPRFAAQHPRPAWACADSRIAERLSASGVQADWAPLRPEPGGLLDWALARLGAAANETRIP